MEILKEWISCLTSDVPEIYLVGGSVRDIVLKQPLKDTDLVCRNAKGIALRFAEGRNAVVVPMEKKPDQPCYRVVDRNNAAKYVDFAEMRGENILEDLSQRDFTINAIAMKVCREGSTGEMIDPFGGIRDAEKKLVRMTRPAIFPSDPLRILRAVRFAAVLQFTIDHETQEEMKRNALLLNEVSAERILNELLLILATPSSCSFFRQLDQMGILGILFPEIEPMRECSQNGYHHLNVWQHSLLVMENCEHILNNLPRCFPGCSDEVVSNLSGDNRMQLLKLAALLHDAGKPATRGINSDTGRITFYGHDEEGARIIESTAERLKMSGKNRDFMVLMVLEHLHVLSLSGREVKPAARMRWFRTMRDDAVPALLLGMADVMGSLGKESTGEYRDSYYAWVRNVLIEYYGSIRMRIGSKALISGNDLISLGMEPGPEMGAIIEQVREAQDTGLISEREDALKLAKQLLTGVRNEE
jgi:putative nucleotidyltransferase with HDIG domain